MARTLVLVAGSSLLSTPVVLAQGAATTQTQQAQVPMEAPGGVSVGGSAVTVPQPPAPPLPALSGNPSVLGPSGTPGASSTSGFGSTPTAAPSGTSAASTAAAAVLAADVPDLSLIHI